MKKKLIILIGALLAVGLGYRWYSASGDRPQFRTLAVMRGDLMIGVSATGRVEPVQIIDVGAQIVGMVKHFGPDSDRPGQTIDYNSRVKEGDVLAQLDDGPHQVELEKAVAGLRLAQAELKESQVHRDQAKRNFDRAVKLRKVNSDAEYETAMSQLEIAQAELAMSEAKVEEAKGVKKEAEIKINYTTIRAPVNGTVISRRVNVGQTVVAGLNAPSLFLLAKDLSRMLVLAAVNEADIGDVHVGQKVTFTVDACRERKFTGKVSQIRLDASMVSSVVTYGVVVDVDNTDGKLMPYTTAKVQFEVARRTDVPLVPDQALRWRPTWDQITPSARAGLNPPAPRKTRPAEEKGAENEADESTVDTAMPTVWVRADDGLVRPMPVKLGLSDGMNTELTGGELQVKDEVVVNTIRSARPDFVSSFVNKVIKK